MNAVKKPITETSTGDSVFLRPRYKLILAIKTPNPTIKKSSCEGLIPNILFNSFFKPNAPSSGKHERFGAASEWFSDDLVCYASSPTNSTCVFKIFFIIMSENLTPSFSVIISLR